LWIGDLTGEAGPVDLSTFRVGRKFGYAVDDELYRLGSEVERLNALLATVVSGGAEGWQIRRRDAA